MFVYILLGGICQQSKNRISIPFCNVVYFLHYSFLIKKMWAVFLGQKCIAIGPLVISPYLSFWVEWKESPLAQTKQTFFINTDSSHYMYCSLYLKYVLCQILSLFSQRYEGMLAKKMWSIFYSGLMMDRMEIYCTRTWFLAA